MPTGRTGTLTLSIKPSPKETMRGASEREHRYIANLPEVLTRDYCGLSAGVIAEPGARHIGQRKSAAGGNE